MQKSFGPQKDKDIEGSQVQQVAELE